MPGQPSTRMMAEARTPEDRGRGVHTGHPAAHKGGSLGGKAVRFHRQPLVQLRHPPT